MAKISRKKTQSGIKQQLLVLNVYAGKHPAKTVVLCLVAIVAIAVAYHQLDTYQRHIVEKKQFAALETQMQASMDKIVANVGKPYELHHGQGCGYIHQKYSQGPLNCNNYYYFDYETDNPITGIPTYQKILDVLKMDGSTDHLYTPDNYGLGDTELYDSFRYGQLATCSLHYQLSTQDYFNNHLENLSKKVGSPYIRTFSYECGATVVKPIYAVEDTQY